MEQIPLKHALICINCNTISRMPKRYCPHCAGEHLVAIGIWLNARPAGSGDPRVDRGRVIRHPRAGAGAENGGVRP